MVAEILNILFVVTTLIGVVVVGLEASGIFTRSKPKSKRLTTTATIERKAFAPSITAETLNKEKK